MVEGIPQLKTHGFKSSHSEAIAPFFQELNIFLSSREAKLGLCNPNPKAQSSQDAQNAVLFH